MASPAIADDAAETTWYKPIAEDAQLRPNLATGVAEEPSSPMVVSALLQLGSYTTADDDEASVGETGLRVQLEQAWTAVFVGVLSLDEVRFFELGAEVNTGGITLWEGAKARLSLMTPAASVRVIGFGSEEGSPTLYGVGVMGLGLRYCRCVSSERPLVVDVRPVYNFTTGSADVMDPITGSTSTIDYELSGLAFTFGGGIRF